MYDPHRIHDRFAQALGPYLCLAVAFGALACPTAFAQWPQFGGPNRDYTAPAAELATEWPEQGPKRLWSKKLGEGYSGIAVDQGVVYTMYRQGDGEIVIALEAATGKQRWKQRYAVKPFRGLSEDFGVGPRSTPLVCGDHVYTVGVCANLRCLDRETGRPVWSHDLMDEYGASRPRWGYACSPLAYEDTIILPVGGKGHSVMAFSQKDGSVVWAKHDFENAYSSPVLIEVDGQEQVVVLMAPAAVGLNPKNGDLLWSYPHETSYNVNASMPIWGDDNTLFVSSAYNTGSRLLKLTRQDDRTRVEELWTLRKMQIHFGSAIRIGDHIYASSGGNGPVFFGAVNVKTGKMVLRERGLVGKAQLLYADGKLVMLDEDGRLYLATATPEGLTIHAKADVLEKISWTAPALAGSTLFLRDKKAIVALDLS